MRAALAIAIACLALVAGAAACAQEPQREGNPEPKQETKQEEIDPSLPIYKMVRSLEDVQDKIVGGDVKAVDMQRFMIGVIDRRLRTASADEFEDMRNVDAAMIYAMSGGNPSTLDYLVSHDARGNFDTRISNALLLYLGGKGTTATKSLDELVPEYKSTAIGPYIALVAANVVMGKKPELALQYFDWARLALPGSIVEEASLRRSLIITVKKNDVERSATLARRYLSRFPNSPYAAQVAEQVITLIDQHHEQLGNQRISDLLKWLDGAREQEVYLRIARKAAVTGRFDFAHWAANQALALSEGRNDNPAKLAELYLSLSNVPTGDIAEVQSAFAKIPDELLGPDERKLRDAGAFILSEVEKPASLESLTQAPVGNTTHDKAKSGSKAHATPGAAHAGTDAKAPTAQPVDAAATKDGTESFVSDGQARLKAIDELMKKGDM